MSQKTRTPSSNSASSQSGNSRRCRWWGTAMGGGRGLKPAPLSGSLAVVEEPLLDQGIERAVGLHRGERRVDRRDEVGAGGEDEAERIGLDRLTDGFEGTRVGTHVAGGRRRIGKHHVDVAGLEGGNRRTERVEGLDPRVVLALGAEEIVNGCIEARGA